MNDKDLEQQYKRVLRPRYEEYGPRLFALVKELLAKESVDVAQVEYRIKQAKSVSRKAKSKRRADPFKDIKDFLGLRVITYYTDDVESIAGIIRREFRVDKKHSVDKRVELGVDAFGYASLHLVFRLKSPRKSLAEWREFADLTAEIQIRSVLQEGMDRAR